MTSLPCWAWTLVMETQTCTLSGECSAVQSFSPLYINNEVSLPVHLSHIETAQNATNEWLDWITVIALPLRLCFFFPSHLLVQMHITRSSAPLIAVSAADPCVLLCVIYLQGCRKWILWLTKGWKMSSSQTSGARSAWRDSAPSVTCWSVMAFHINTYAHFHSEMHRRWICAENLCQLLPLLVAHFILRATHGMMVCVRSHGIHNLQLSVKLITHNRAPTVSWCSSVCLYTRHLISLPRHPGTSQLKMCGKGRPLKIPCKVIAETLCLLHSMQANQLVSERIPTGGRTTLDGRYHPMASCEAPQC